MRQPGKLLPETTKEQKIELCSIFGNSQAKMRSGVKRFGEGYRSGRSVCRIASPQNSTSPQTFREDRGPVSLKRKELLCFLLLLLTDTNLEVLLLGFLVRLVIVTRDGIFQIRIYIGILRQDRHKREILVAGRAKWPKALYIRNGHNLQNTWIRQLDSGVHLSKFKRLPDIRIEILPVPSDRHYP